MALLALTACASTHPAPVDPRTVTVAPLAPAVESAAAPSEARVRELLRDAFDGAETPASIIASVRAALGRSEGATIEVPHGDHTHFYVLRWLPSLRALVFFERTGDGIENLRAVSVD